MTTRAKDLKYAVQVAYLALATVTASDFSNSSILTFRAPTADSNSFAINLVPHCPVPGDDEINRDLARAFNMLQGLYAPAEPRAVYRSPLTRYKQRQKVASGMEREDVRRGVVLLLREILTASLAFFTSPKDP